MAGLLPILTRNGIDRLCFMFTCRCTLSRTLTTDIVHRQSSTVNDISQDATPLAVSQPLPLITSRKIDYPTAWREPRQAWLESLTTVEDEKLGIIDLHPDVFATYPRIDLIHRNVMWQTDYKKVKYERVRNRAEMRGGGRKPWPQKGLGRARAGSIRSPLFKGGGISHGPRGPESFYYMLTRSIRERGLRCTLSVKFAQDDLHIIDSLDIPSEDPEYIQELIKARNWGLSVLFVDDADVMPRNIALATADIKQFNVMPVYGLNVYSMLKHETLILTLAAVERIEEKLVAEMQIPGQEMSYKPKVRN